MNKTIYHKSRYYDYFKWHHYYSYHYPDEFPESDPVCEMCATFNLRKQSHARSSHMNISSFWDPNNKKVSNTSRLKFQNSKVNKNVSLAKNRNTLFLWE